MNIAVIPEGKICNYCKVLFVNTGQNQKYCSIKCRDKVRWLQTKWANDYRLRNPKRTLLTYAKSRAKKRGLAFDVTECDFSLPTHCPILGIELKFNYWGGAGGKDSSYSLDRIDASKGYVKGNIQVISHKANSMKFTASKEELLLFAKWIKETYE